MKHIDHPYPDLDYVCSECGAKFGELPTDDDELMLCEDCLEHHYHQCENCERWFAELNDDDLCESCADDQANEQPNQKVD